MKDDEGEKELEETFSPPLTSSPLTRRFKLGHSASSSRSGIEPVTPSSASTFGLGLGLVNRNVEDEKEDGMEVEVEPILEYTSEGIYPWQEGSKGKFRFMKMGMGGYVF